MLMKAEFRISVKDYARGENLKMTLSRVPFSTRQFFGRLNGQWEFLPQSGWSS